METSPDACGPSLLIRRKAPNGRRKWIVVESFEYNDRVVLRRPGNPLVQINCTKSLVQELLQKGYMRYE